ncbi:hypothetical protein, partial [Stomatohabitans albus]
MSAITSAWIQAKADIRVNLVGFTILNHIIAPAIFVIATILMIRNTDPSYTPIIIGSLYSGIASYS